MIVGKGKNQRGEKKIMWDPPQIKTLHQRGETEKRREPLMKLQF